MHISLLATISQHFLFFEDYDIADIESADDELLTRSRKGLNALIERHASRQSRCWHKITRLLVMHSYRDWEDEMINIYERDTSIAREFDEIIDAALLYIIYYEIMSQLRKFTPVLGKKAHYIRMQATATASFFRAYCSATSTFSFIAFAPKPTSQLPSSFTPLLYEELSGNVATAPPQKILILSQVAGAYASTI